MLCCQRTWWLVWLPFLAKFSKTHWLVSQTAAGQSKLLEVGVQETFTFGTSASTMLSYWEVETYLGAEQVQRISTRKETPDPTSSKCRSPCLPANFANKKSQHVQAIGRSQNNAKIQKRHCHPTSDLDHQSGPA
jgi:hypothetical protein